MNINEMRSMTESFKDTKLNKDKELNKEMSIDNKEKDEYTKTIHNVGGNK